MRTQSIEERVDNEIALLKAMPRECLAAHADQAPTGLASILHEFPGTEKGTRSGCWLERYATLHELPFWGHTALHLQAAGVGEDRANWLQNEVYHRNDHAVACDRFTDKAESAMRQLISERIIAAEAMGSKPNVCSMIETELMEVMA